MSIILNFGNNSGGSKVEESNQLHIVGQVNQGYGGDGGRTHPNVWPKRSTAQAPGNEVVGRKCRAGMQQNFNLEILAGFGGGL
jgi:hypothetical protein